MGTMNQPVVILGRLLMSKRFSKRYDRFRRGYGAKKPSPEELLAAARAVLTERIESASKAPYCVISCSSRASRPGRPVSVTVHYCLNQDDVKAEIDAAQKVHGQPGHLGFAFDAAIAPGTIASYLIQEMERVFGGSAAVTESLVPEAEAPPPATDAEVAAILRDGR